MHMLDDRDQFAMYPVPEAAGISDLQHNPSVDQVISDSAPDVRYKLFRNPEWDHRTTPILQYYCIRDGGVFGVMCRLSNKGSTMLNFCRDLLKHDVNGRYRISMLPGFVGRLLREDPWGLWMTVSVQDAARLVGRHW